MTNYQLTSKAKFRLRNIAEYTKKEWGEKQLNSYLKDLFITFENISNSPTLGKLREEIGTNIRSYSSNKHIIYYYEKSDYIVIFDILHEKMDPYKNIP